MPKKEFKNTSLVLSCRSCEGMIFIRTTFYQIVSGLLFIIDFMLLIIYEKTYERIRNVIYFRTCFETSIHVCVIQVC